MIFSIYFLPHLLNDTNKLKGTVVPFNSGDKGVVTTGAGLNRAQYYAPGIGLVFIEELEGKTLRVELIKINP